MNEIRKRNLEELSRLYDVLNNLEPGTKEYETIQMEIIKAVNVESEFKKEEIENRKVVVSEKEAKTAKRNSIVEHGLKILTFSAGVIIPPLITLACQKELVKEIGTIEQMETFTTTPGRSISSWFKVWK